MCDEAWIFPDLSHIHSIMMMMMMMLQSPLIVLHRPFLWCFRTATKCNWVVKVNALIFPHATVVDSSRFYKQWNHESVDVIKLYLWDFRQQREYEKEKNSVTVAIFSSSPHRNAAIKWSFYIPHPLNYRWPEKQKAKNLFELMLLLLLLLVVMVVRQKRWRSIIDGRKVNIVCVINNNGGWKLKNTVHAVNFYSSIPSKTILLE